MLKADLKLLLQSESIGDELKSFEDEIDQGKEDDFQEYRDDTEDDKGADNDTYLLSAMEMEMINNFSIGFFQYVHEFMLKVQNHRLTLIEWTLLWKELRIYVALVQRWDKNDLPWIEKLQTRYHETAEKDLKDLWCCILSIMDTRSSQFNDRLVSIVESLFPFPIGLQHSYADNVDVLEKFLGKGPLPREDEREFMLWDLGPRVVHRIITLQASNSPGIVPILDIVREKIHAELSLFHDRSTWTSSWIGKSHDPIEFWDHQKSTFPYLSCLALSMFKLEVTNANVERSMKTLGSIVTTKRNSLSIAKINEEMMIKYNLKKYEQNVKSFHRSKDFFCKFETNYKEVWKITKELEKNVIDMIDNFAIVPPEVAQDQVTHQVVKLSRKTKLFELIEKNPDYLPKKRSTRGTIRNYQVDEDDDDEDYEE